MSKNIILVIMYHGHKCSNFISSALDEKFSMKALMSYLFTESNIANCKPKYKPCDIYFLQTSKKLRYKIQNCPILTASNRELPGSEDADYSCRAV
jgi:hypothetical protein